LERAEEDSTESGDLWGFIDKERHSVVHAYDIRIERVWGGDPAEPGHFSIGVHLESLVSKPGRVGRALVPEPVPSKIKYGPFHGRDEQEVAAEAIEWWEQYLDKIERAAEQQPTI
jgi:hypothetical protein